MSLNKLFIFVFVFFGFFSILLATMPPEFRALNVEADVHGKEARDYFTSQDVTMYNYTVSLNLTRGSSESEDFGLPDDEKLEFWWDWETTLMINKILFELRHTKPGLWGWWTDYHQLAVQEPYASDADVLYPTVGLQKEEVLALFDEDINASYCEFACDHIHVKLFILPYNQSWTLEESWDNNKLKLYTSYGIDWTATGTSMWGILFQLLSFQDPNLGIPGDGGAIIGAGVSLFLWASIAIMAYAIITAIIPFIPGWQGG